MCFLVGSSRELYPRVHNRIVNLTAWFLIVYQRNYFIFLQRVCKNYSLHVNRKHCHLVTFTFTSCIPHVMGAAILFPFDQVMCDWLNHTTWFHLNPALPWSMEFESILFHFLTQYDANILCRLFDDHKYMDIYISLYITNTAILENKKSVCIFPQQPVNNCDLHIFRLLKCAICSIVPVKMALIGQFEKFF